LGFIEGSGVRGKPRKQKEPKKFVTINITQGFIKGGGDA